VHPLIFAHLSALKIQVREY